MTDVSTQRLVKALEEQNDPTLYYMILQARQSFYHDYKSPIATPILQLVNDLRARGYHDLAQRAINGEFDATKEESDEWAKSPDGQQAFRELFGDTE